METFVDTCESCGILVLEAKGHHRRVGVDAVVSEGTAAVTTPGRWHSGCFRRDENVGGSDSRVNRCRLNSFEGHHTKLIKQESYRTGCGVVSQIHVGVVIRQTWEPPMEPVQHILRYTNSDEARTNHGEVDLEWEGVIRVVLYNTVEGTAALFRKPHSDFKLRRWEVTVRVLDLIHASIDAIRGCSCNRSCVISRV